MSLNDEHYWKGYADAIVDLEHFNESQPEGTPKLAIRGWIEGVRKKFTLPTEEPRP